MLTTALRQPGPGSAQLRPPQEHPTPDPLRAERVSPLHRASSAGTSTEPGSATVADLHDFSARPASTRTPLSRPAPIRRPVGRAVRRRYCPAPVRQRPVLTARRSTSLPTGCPGPCHYRRQRRVSGHRRVGRQAGAGPWFTGSVPGPACVARRRLYGWTTPSARAPRNRRQPSYKPSWGPPRIASRSTLPGEPGNTLCAAR